MAIEEALQLIKERHWQSPKGLLYSDYYHLLVGNNGMPGTVLGRQPLTELSLQGPDYMLSCMA